MSEPEDDGSRVGRFLAGLSYRWLAPGALLLAAMPWPIEETPHLVDKTRMLLAGELTGVIDIIDLVWHSWALVLLAVKLVYDLTGRVRG